MMDGRAGKPGTHESRNRIYTRSGRDTSHSEHLSQSLYRIRWNYYDTRVCVAEEGVDAVDIISSSLYPIDTSILATCTGLKRAPFSSLPIFCNLFHFPFGKLESFFPHIIFFHVLLDFISSRFHFPSQRNFIPIESRNSLYSSFSSSICAIFLYVSSFHIISLFHSRGSHIFSIISSCLDPIEMSMFAT